MRAKKGWEGRCHTTKRTGKYHQHTIDMSRNKNLEISVPECPVAQN
jgi:hypothetical protein